MQTKHQDLFEKFDATFRTETTAKWEKMVKDWEADDNKPNPYAEPINSKLCRIFFRLYFSSLQIISGY